MENKQSSINSFEFFICLLQLLFIHEKLEGTITWNWGVVLSPFISFGLLGIVAFVVGKYAYKIREKEKAQVKKLLDAAGVRDRSDVMRDIFSRKKGKDENV